MKIRLLFILLLGLSLSLSGYCNGDIFIHIGEEEGLSQRWVMAVLEDQYGFMWFGTKDGLNRYDGFEFKYYRYNPDNSGLPSSSINFLYEDQQGTLWACTTKGICRYNREVDKFILFPYISQEDVENMLQTEPNLYWFATKNGLYKYNSLENSIRQFRHSERNPSGLCNDLITCLLEDNNKNIWIGTQSGLCLINPRDTIFTALNPGQYSNTHIFDLAMDGSGRIWISDYHNGIDLFTNNENSYKSENFHHIIQGFARALQIDPDNNLWVSWGQKQGIQSFNLNYLNIEKGSIEAAGINPQNLTPNSIDNIYLDKGNNLWFGTYERGVFYQSNAAKKFYSISEENKNETGFSSYIVNAFFEDEEFKWYGTEFGLNRYELSTGVVRQYVHEPGNINSLGANAVYAITKDSKGNLWIGTWNGGLNLYNPKSDDFTRIIPDQEESEKIFAENIFSIVEVSEDELWLGSIYGGGLLKYEVNTHKFADLSSLLFETGAPHNNSVNQILKASDGKIWISGYSAIHFYDPELEKFSWFAFSPDNRNSLTLGETSVLFEDSRKNIWVGTEGGLNCYLPKTGSFKRYTMLDGLPGNFINGIQEDESGNLWLSSNQGITKFINGTYRPESPEFINYTKVDGISSREFIKRSSYKDSKGRLYFGGVNGYTYFYPDSIVKNPNPPKVLLVDLSIWNERTILGTAGSVLPKAIYLLDEIELKYHQNMLTFHYAALNYINPEKNSFVYKLEGYDESWVDARGNHSAVYTNLDPGRYVLRVKASNNDGVWNNEGTSLNIYIHSPWWGTSFARIVFVLMLITSLLLLYRFRVRALTNKKEVLERKVKERTQELVEVNTVLEDTKEEVTLQNEELLEHRHNLQRLVEERTVKLQNALEKAKAADRLKSSFLANMSHEIRTPMNSIVGFTSLLDDENLDSETKSRYINIINSNSEMLLVLINDILEISLIEANQVIIENQLFDLGKAFTELEETFKIRNDKKLLLEFINKNEEQQIILNTDAIRLNQCMTNLINNAIKFTDEGYVKFGYTIKEGEIECYVSDSGIGIDKSETKKILNYFYKIENDKNRLYRGTGLGLAITLKLVKLMDGTLRIDSDPDIGSTFYICLPYKQGLVISEKTEAIRKSIPGKFMDLLILVADDEKANYYLVEEILKKTEATIVVVENGLEAVEFVKANSENKNLLVLMDIKMPVMDGLSALKEIQKAKIDVPVIAFTAHARIRDRKELLAAGFTNYLSKPIKPKRLLDIINSTMFRNS